MSASAKPVERVFKSFLAAVLAISLCPLMPAEKAQAEETGDSGELGAFGVVADEGEGGGTDSGSENPAPAVESDSIDNDVAVLQTSESEAPIVDWRISGTCQWMIDADGCLIIEPQSGEYGTLCGFSGARRTPWYGYRNYIVSVKVRKRVVLEDAAGMFDGCSSLESVDLSSLDTSKAQEMQRMFSGCSKLTSLDLSSLDTSKAGDMSYMFYGCSSLASLDLSSFDTANVWSMSSMFDGCLRLEALDLSSFNTGNAVYMDSMFEGCQSLKAISSPAVLNTSKVENFSSMFSGCRSLEGLDVSGFDTSAARSLSSMFDGCTKLAALDVSNFDTSVATSLGWMFYGCERLRSLDLSGFDTSAADYRYGLSGFLDGCKSLRTVTLGQKFAFEGAGLDRQCSLPTPRGDRLTGHWVSSADGMAYAPNDIPSNMAATYTAQVAAFADVDYSDSSWYGDAVSYVVSRGLITGYTDGDKAGQFGVGDTLKRAQLATILWRNACPDEYASYDPETAVDTTGISGSADGMYYTAAANWAVKNGVITGFDRDDGTKDFAADDDVSFEQLVTILARLCATPDELAAAGSDLSAFADGYLASDWSRGAFAWAAAKGLVQGYDEPTGKYLRPGDPVARERVAVVLTRAFEMGVLK